MAAGTAEISVSFYSPSKESSITQGGRFMPRKGENMYKRKDGRWEGRYIRGRSPEGKAIYGYLYAPSYLELKKKMAKAERYQEGPPAGRDDVFRGVSFRRAAEEWTASVRPRIRESTGVKYGNLLDSYILPELGGCEVGEITHGKLETFCSSLLLTGGVKGTGLSPKTVSDCLSIVRRILQQSAENGCRLQCDGSSVTVRQSVKDMRVLSKREQRILCGYLKGHPGERNLGILICLFTGMRVGELCALQWKDISFSEKTIYVHRTMQRIQVKESPERRTKILISTPKSACSVRLIPVPDELLSILSQYQKTGEAYVLTGMEEKYIEPRTMQNHFYRVLQECSINRMNFHSLRHTFATRCVELGFDVKSLSEILGHANVNITMNRYVHPSMELKRKNMMRLSELIAVR